ncbi:MAG: hypothetical protein N2Z40_07630 [Caldimicrobium sp.]|nr:hypothetical protein [Caldimicrobium sp.]MCX7614066.1 hypothetical protein [Caldimicrobium sp.]MDW8182855.1 hypothetical protein [Caldimicrobium sp.]
MYRKRSTLLTLGESLLYQDLPDDTLSKIDKLIELKWRGRACGVGVVRLANR